MKPCSAIHAPETSLTSPAPMIARRTIELPTRLVSSAGTLIGRGNYLGAGEMPAECVFLAVNVNRGSRASPPGIGHITKLYGTPLSASRQQRSRAPIPYPRTGTISIPLATRHASYELARKPNERDRQ